MFYMLVHSGFGQAYVEDQIFHKRPSISGNLDLAETVEGDSEEEVIRKAYDLKEEIERLIEEQR